MKLFQLKKVIKETIKEINSEKQPLNEEKAFFDCQREWLTTNGPGILDDHTNSTTGEIDMQGYFQTSLSGAINACKDLLKVSNQQLMTKN